MEVLHTHCAGFDVHKDTVVACARLMVDGKVTREVRTFKTTTSDLLVLSEWLASLGITHIAMEATGVYWKASLERSRRRRVRVAVGQRSPRQERAPGAQARQEGGRKTDVNDATWSRGSSRPSSRICLPTA